MGVPKTSFCILSFFCFSFAEIFCSSDQSFYSFYFFSFFLFFLHFDIQMQPAKKEKSSSKILKVKRETFQSSENRILKRGELLSLKTAFCYDGVVNDFKINCHKQLVESKCLEKILNKLYQFRKFELSMHRLF
jgi:hypothetical protein